MKINLIVIVSDDFGVNFSTEKNEDGKNDKLMEGRKYQELVFEVAMEVKEFLKTEMFV
jgi:hypothetical protein